MNGRGTKKSLTFRFRSNLFILKIRWKNLSGMQSILISHRKSLRLPFSLAKNNEENQHNT